MHYTKICLKKACLQGVPCTVTSHCGMSLLESYLAQLSLVFFFLLNLTSVIFINENTSILGLLCSCQAETCLFITLHIIWVCVCALQYSSQAFLHPHVEPRVGSSTPAKGKTTYTEQWGDSKMLLVICSFHLSLNGWGDWGPCILTSKCHLFHKEDFVLRIYQVLNNSALNRRSMRVSQPVMCQ